MILHPLTLAENTKAKYGYSQVYDDNMETIRRCGDRCCDIDVAQHVPMDLSFPSALLFCFCYPNKNGMISINLF